MDSITDYLSAANSAVSALGGLANTYLVSKTHTQDRSFAREMYNRQKEDNLEFWNMQNEYNSPSSQLGRYVDAGLNPNLMYGQGTPGNASSPAAGGKYTPSFGPVPQFTELDVLGKYYDNKLKAAQADNIMQQTDESRSRESYNSARTDTENELRELRKELLNSNIILTDSKKQNVAYDNAIKEWMVQREPDPSGGRDLEGTSYMEKYLVNILRQQNEDIKLLGEKNKLTAAQTLTEFMKPSVMQANIAELQSKTNLNYATAENLYRNSLLAWGNFQLAAYQAYLNPYKGQFGGIVNPFANEIFNALDNIFGTNWRQSVGKGGEIDNTLKAIESIFGVGIPK